MPPIKSVPAARFYNVGSPDVVAILQETLHNYPLQETLHNYPLQETLHNYPFPITYDKGQGLLERATVGDCRCQGQNLSAKVTYFT